MNPAVFIFASRCNLRPDTKITIGVVQYFAPGFVGVGCGSQGHRDSTVATHISGVSPRG